jgi:hypothetical protein
MASEEPSSWGETIRAYESGKKALPWRPGDVQPVQKLGAFEVTHSHTHSLTCSPMTMTTLLMIQSLKFDHCDVD